MAKEVNKDDQEDLTKIKVETERLVVETQNARNANDDIRELAALMEAQSVGGRNPYLDDKDNQWGSDRVVMLKRNVEEKLKKMLEEARREHHDERYKKLEGVLEVVSDDAKGLTLDMVTFLKK